jgi:hypothetical protein
MPEGQAFAVACDAASAVGVEAELRVETALGVALTLASAAVAVSSAEACAHDATSGAARRIAYFSIGTREPGQA